MAKKQKQTYPYFFFHPSYNVPYHWKNESTEKKTTKKYVFFSKWDRQDTSGSAKGPCKVLLHLKQLEKWGWQNRCINSPIFSFGWNLQKNGVKWEEKKQGSRLAEENSIKLTANSHVIEEMSQSRHRTVQMPITLRRVLWEMYGWCLQRKHPAEGNADLFPLTKVTVKKMDCPKYLQFILWDGKYSGIYSANSGNFLRESIDTDAPKP